MFRKYITGRQEQLQISQILFSGKGIRSADHVVWTLNHGIYICLNPELIVFLDNNFIRCSLRISRGDFFKSFNLAQNTLPILIDSICLILY